MSKEVEATTRQYLFLQKYLNSARKDSRDTNDKDKTKVSTSGGSKTDEDWLTKWVICLLSAALDRLFTFLIERRSRSWKEKSASTKSSVRRSVRWLRRRREPTKDSSSRRWASAWRTTGERRRSTTQSQPTSWSNSTGNIDLKAARRSLASGSTSTRSPRSGKRNEEGAARAALMTDSSDPTPDLLEYIFKKTFYTSDQNKNLD